MFQRISCRQIQLINLTGNLIRVLLSKDFKQQLQARFLHLSRPKTTPWTYPLISSDAVKQQSLEKKQAVTGT